MGIASLWLIRGDSIMYNVHVTGRHFLAENPSPPNSLTLKRTWLSMPRWKVTESRTPSMSKRIRNWIRDSENNNVLNPRLNPVLNPVLNPRLRLRNGPPGQNWIRDQTWVEPRFLLGTGYSRGPLDWTSALSQGIDRYDNYRTSVLRRREWGIVECIFPNLHN